jgi:hypothetical protein
MVHKKNTQANDSKTFFIVIVFFIVIQIIDFQYLAAKLPFFRKVSSQCFMIASFAAAL